MNSFQPRQYKSSTQYLICLLSVLLVAGACHLSAEFIGYKTVALILLMTVSVLAMLFDILPVLLAAVLSALIWNFLFIPPKFTFHISNTEDFLMFLLYFFIALVNAVLSFKIRKEQKKTRDKEEKEKTIKLYNTLLNSLSHELRTPIATVLGAVDTLKENEAQLTAANRNELLSQIDTAAIRLNTQVENLLSMSRLETGMLRLNTDWYDTNELINSIIHRLALEHTQSIVFEPDDSLPLFKYDRGLIEQVILNLLQNAINYTPAGSAITITAKHQDDNCIITIADNGKGIDEKELPHIFDKFYRVQQSKTGGSGLGLSIVKGYVEAHNGKVYAHNNKPSAGVTFTVEIPAQASYLNHLKNE